MTAMITPKQYQSFADYFQVRHDVSFVVRWFIINDDPETRTR